VISSFFRLDAIASSRILVRRQSHFKKLLQSIFALQQFLYFL
jgi:hypothetical protein